MIDVESSETALLYRSPESAGVHKGVSTPALSANEYMVIAGHSWSLSIASQPRFETRLGRDATHAVVGVALRLRQRWLWPCRWRPIFVTGGVALAKVDS
jgi:hypothetical protein